ncbi:MAG: DUF3276 family protein [Candidatus Promineifilaceae bacterium]|nr:DUF3276 family protein [Candidatus Promineifilaceae bacterium]
MSTNYHERLAKIKAQYPRACEKWTPEDEALLAEMQRAGKTVQEISEALQRQPSAVHSRIKKNKALPYQPQLEIESKPPVQKDQTMPPSRKELFTNKVPAGRRTYFFDIKETRENERYLVISESQKSGSTYKHDRVMIFEEHLEAFLEGLDKALMYLFPGNYP